MFSHQKQPMNYIIKLKIRDTIRYFVSETRTHLFLIFAKWIDCFFLVYNTFSRIYKSWILYVSEKQSPAGCKNSFFCMIYGKIKKVRELYHGSVDKVWLAVINSFHCGLYHHPLMCISLMETWAPAFVGKRDIRYNRKWWEAFFHPGKQLFPRISGSIANYYWYAGSAAICIPLPVTKIQVWIGTLTPALWNIKVIEAI